MFLQSKAMMEVLNADNLKSFMEYQLAEPNNRLLLAVVAIKIVL